MNTTDNVRSYGVGPIDVRVSQFGRVLLFNGKRVQFSQTDNTAAIKELYGWLLQYNMMPDEATQNLKNNEKSKEFRIQGNKLFQQRSFTDALEFYNKSICWAEHGRGEELSLGYGNRSAVYFEWELYDNCIANINLAVEAGIPRRLMAKLNRRRGDCIKRMENLFNKETVPTNDDQKCGKLQTFYVDKLYIKECDRRTILSKRYCFDVNLRTTPKLSFEANPKIPFIANCLEMKSSLGQGRFIVTKEDLKPGQIISIEDPYTTALTKEHCYRKCGNCFAENFLSLIPCPSCTCTMFCSEQCLTESGKGFHLFECPVAEFIWTQCEEYALTLRLVVKAFQTFDSVEELIEFREKNKQANMTPFSFDYKTDLSDKDLYSQVDNLLTNENKRCDFDLFSRCSKVAILYHQLIENTKFQEMLNTVRYRDTLISVIMQHTQTSSINSFNCYQYDDIDLDAFKEFKEISVFTRGLYPFSSLFNHSCAPNTATIASGTKLVTYVTRAIKRNSEVTGCYKRINHFEQHKYGRSTLLPLGYHFNCECEACKNDFPMWNEENLPLGYVTEEIRTLSDGISPNLDMDYNQIERFCSILQEYSSHYPRLSMYNIGLKLHRALTLKFGNLSTELMVMLKANCSKYTSAMRP